MRCFMSQRATAQVFRVLTSECLPIWSVSRASGCSVVSFGPWVRKPPPFTALVMFLLVTAKSLPLSSSRQSKHLELTSQKFGRGLSDRQCGLEVNLVFV